MKNILVLGASKEGGTGWEIAHHLARDGARLTVGARSAEGIGKLSREIGGLAVPCDATREEDMRNIVARAAEAGGGRIDAAVLVAGEGTLGNIDDISDDLLRRTFDLNYFAGVYFLRHAARAMRDGGSIVLMSSIAARRPWKGYFSYGTAKAALEMLVRYGALEYAPRGIRVNGVAPGPIQTAASAARHNDPEIWKVFAEETPLGRTVRAQEVAEAVAWLVNGAPWITGETISIDGGMHLRRAPDPEALKEAAARAAARDKTP